MNIKKIIAREGLIIIAICLLLGIFLYFNNREQNRKNNYEKNATVVEIVEVEKVAANTDDKLKAAGFSEKEIADYHAKAGPWEIIENRKLTGMYVMVPKSINESRLMESLKRDFPNLKKPSYEQLSIVAETTWVPTPTYQLRYDANGKPITFVNYDTVLLAVVLLYPVYLLLRFILWSIKTLRK